MGKGPVTVVVGLDADVVAGAIVTGVDVSTAATLDSLTTVLAVDVGATVSSGASVSFDESPRTEHDDPKTMRALPTTARANPTRRVIM